MFSFINTLQIMENKQSNIQEEYEQGIYRYCEIIYNMLQTNPELYDEFIHKATYRIVSENGIPIDENETYKIAA